MRVSAVLAALAAGEFSIYGDCGSTATRVYLIEVVNASVAPRIEKIGKGAAVTAVLDGPAAAESFVDLVARAIAKVPPEARHGVSVNGLATAGMRSRSDEEQRRVWRELRAALNEAEHAAVGGRVLAACEPPPGADPRCEERVAFRTISGHEEGVFGLVAANALARQEAPHVVGVLDLGGSSTQLALPHSDVADPIALARPGPHGESFVRSYDWGMEKARQKLATPACFAADVPLAEALGGGAAGFGAPDAPACRAALRAGLRAEAEHCEAAACLGESVPWASTPLLAMSGFFYVADYADHVAGVAGYPTPKFADLERAADVVCATAASDLEGRPHPFTDAVKQRHRCFELNYLLELFALYSLPDDGRVRFVGSIGGTEVEWTLGAYLVDQHAAKQYV